MAKYYGDTKEQQCEKLLGGLLKSAAAASDRAQESSLLTTPAESDSDEEEERIVFNGSSVGRLQAASGPAGAHASAAVQGRKSATITVSRQRVTNLAELQADVVKGVEERYRQQQYGNRHGYGRLVTDVIRAVKAWSKYGLPAALHASGIAAEDCKGPANYCWEIFVLYVLQQQTLLKAAKGDGYDQSKPLELFMDVLQQASVILRTTSSTEEALARAIMLDHYYTRQEAQQPVFQQLWGEGELYIPYIINPVDPTYNCTAMQPFRYWNELAAAAGQLHQQLDVGMQGGWGDSRPLAAAGDGAATAAGGGSSSLGGHSSSGTAWTWVCMNSSLGRAWNEFNPFSAIEGPTV